jgi:cyclopropane-fatty-acyl-phospholipid synthase
MERPTIVIDGKPCISGESVPGVLDRLAKRMVISLLKSIEIGQLTLEENGERRAFGKPSAKFPLHGAITVHHPRFYRTALWGGSIGAAEAYMSGFWSADDLTVVIRLMVINRHIFEKMDRGWGRLTEPVHQYFHWLNKNTKAGSRANITAV